MHNERAFAKLNLFLSVTERREDGYHDILSVMQAVSLCDFLSLEYFPGIHTSVRLEISGNGNLPADCRNLAYRAAEAFLKKTERRGEVQIRLDKRIPMAAGLGGGSADAAAVLRGLNRLCGDPLSTDELCALGATLGADVPFCIRGGTALASGVGEVLEPMEPMPDATLVVACAGEGVSTPEAYRLIDEREACDPASDARIDAISAALCKGDLASAIPNFYNAFEGVIAPLRPQVGKIRKSLLSNGAAFAMMSGSGPSVFGIFPRREDAERAALSLQSEGIPAFVCHPTRRI